jgi:hypothetical protein
VAADGSLIVYNVTDADAGVYECLADNGRDRQSAEARFSIRELPPPPPVVTPSQPSQSSQPSPSNRHCRHCSMSQHNLAERVDKASNTDKSCVRN